MASLDILRSNLLNLKNKITKIKHEKIFCGPLKILKNNSSSINICLKYFMTPTKTLWFPHSYILNVQSLTKEKKADYCNKLDLNVVRENKMFWKTFSLYFVNNPKKR